MNRGAAVFAILVLVRIAIPPGVPARESGSADSPGFVALRGGSWRVGPEVVTTTYRNGYRTDYSHGSIGFRLVREMVP